MPGALSPYSLLSHLTLVALVLEESLTGCRSAHLTFTTAGLRWWASWAWWVRSSPRAASSSRKSAAGSVERAVSSACPLPCMCRTRRKTPRESRIYILSSRMDLFRRWRLSTCLTSIVALGLLSAQMCSAAAHISRHAGTEGGVRGWVGGGGSGGFGHIFAAAWARLVTGSCVSPQDDPHGRPRPRPCVSVCLSVCL